MNNNNRNYHNKENRRINNIDEHYEDNYQYYTDPYSEQHQGYEETERDINYDEQNIKKEYIDPTHSLYDYPYEQENEKNTNTGRLRTGRKKIEMIKIPQRNRRSVTFSKRKKGLMKKAYELSVLTGAEVLLLLASESGHVYTFATPKLKPIVANHEGLIQQCLNVPVMEEMDDRHTEYDYRRIDDNMHKEYFDEYEQMYRQQYPPREK